MCPSSQSMNAFEANLMKISFPQNPKQSSSCWWKFSATVITAQLLVISTYCKHTNLSTLIESDFTRTKTGTLQAQHLTLSTPGSVWDEAQGNIAAPLKSVLALAKKGLGFHVLNSNTFTSFLCLGLVLGCFFEAFAWFWENTDGFI